MLKKQKGLLFIIIFMLLSSSISLNSVVDHFSKKSESSSHEVNISSKRETHILYGDARGGGHLYGVGKPCKSEFPKHWNKEKIIGNIKTLAANDNLNWRQQRNGYYVAEDMIDGLRVRVVLDGEKDDVVTAYPVNVKRNVCDTKKPANDNFNE